MNKTMVLLSGGVDSTSLLWKAVREVGKENVLALNMYYGQKHAIEKESAMWQAEKAGVPYMEKDLSTVFGEISDSSALLKGSNKEIAHESYAEQLKHTDVVSAYVPYRNGLFLSVAAAIAYAKGYDIIAYGAHADDAVRRNNGAGTAAYPDCTAAFIHAQQDAVYEGTGNKVQIWAPLANLTKAGVVAFGIDAMKDLGFNDAEIREIYGHTHSCYEGVKGGCGTCGTCIDRAAAFNANPVTVGLR